MGSLRAISLVSMLVGILVVASGCTGSDPKPNFSPASTGAASASQGASTSPGASASPTPVPVDEIPPGNPEEWVPAGVPTTAKYKEPGDVVPKFTLDMFSKTRFGAVAAAAYYFDARRWAIATINAAPFLIICDAAQCKSDAKFYSDARRKHRHVVGCRSTQSQPHILKAPASSGATWIVQVHESVVNCKVIGQHGEIVEHHPGATFISNIYLKWNQKMWRVSDDFLAE
jgi:hypothetical protein